MMQLGPALVLVVVFIVWAVPIAAGIWALVALGQIRASQRTIEKRLGAIESALQNR